MGIGTIEWGRVTIMMVMSWNNWGGEGNNWDGEGDNRDSERDNRDGDGDGDNRD